MPTRDLGFYLSAVEKTAAQPSITPGGSGYFSTPEKVLDPRLFQGQHLLPEVRQWVLSTFYDYMDQHYKGARSWSTVWAAGSGISYQWAADRSNGDLDILIGVDFPHFYAVNKEYAGTPEEDMADIFNRGLHTDLWPKTTNYLGVFEATFYINPGGKDIRDINPYAAYDITHDQWTVTPPVLPSDPSSLYPAEYREAVGAEQSLARTLVDRHAELRRVTEASPENSPGWVNAVHGLGLVATQARALFDSIHLGRKNAFGEQGKGYGDYYNYRWQAHKQAGTVQALAALSQIDKDARGAWETQTYGSPLTGASEALSRASLVRAGAGR